MLFSNRGIRYTGFFFILGYRTDDESFLAGIRKNDDIQPVGFFSQGLKEEEKRTLIQAISANRKPGSDPVNVRVDPGICVELSFTAIENGGLVHPMFRSFQLGVDWKACTWDKLVIDNAPAGPNGIKVTHPDKLVWKDVPITKEGYISYLLQVSPVMLPFLEQRVLTNIRYTQGIPGEFFYQKNCPDYAPDFIQTVKVNDIDYIVCDNVSTLGWLGNQMAIEYHIPFNRIGADKPLEIVFDLDPPSREQFSLAVKAAIEMRNVFEGFGVISYPKVSGGKGLQIHIPLGNRSSLTYDDTRVFTEFVAKYLVERFPGDFTIERLKKNRGGKLYLDYIQHAEGKTIICPYSPRGTDEATVAAPLYWDEVQIGLSSKSFTIPTVLERLSKGECPMSGYFQQTNAAVPRIISMLKEQLVGSR
ncbi:non-homologous end-joining DNA ligase [Paenibacillus nanensis]|uniref:non-homologous end-joining DNA ligase n=1 Tax=Paenibacillus nanensis TaxID=393251 RepID=UPI001F0BF30C|nr:non-homologous end-joining DNA ligase [Paenibacillus nanensis]